MGSADDPMAVVEQPVKVRGVEGRRVVDASGMPDVGRTNPTVPTMMIAERAADCIKDGRGMPAAARGDQASNP